MRVWVVYVRGVWCEGVCSVGGACVMVCVV